MECDAKEISDAFIDGDGNMQLKVYMMDEITLKSQWEVPTSGTLAETLTSIPKNLTGKKRNTFEHRNLGKNRIHDL